MLYYNFFKSNLRSDLFSGDKLEAVTWYVKGISVLEKGIQVPISGATPEDKEKITRLQAKMIKNLEMARERLKILGK